MRIVDSTLCVAAMALLTVLVYHLALQGWSAMSC
jgi:hypothetical protein